MNQKAENPMKRDDKTWWDKHGKTVKIIAIGVGVAATVCLGYKYRRELAWLGKGAVKKVERLASKITQKGSGAASSVRPVAVVNAPENRAGGPHIKIVPALKEVAKAAPSIPDNFLENLSGERRPPQGIGRLLGISSQEVNKRLVEIGLQIPYGNGYKPTEFGSKFGGVVWKTTRYGYEFSNIEWDTIVAKMIDKPLELPNIRAQLVCNRQIM